MNDVTPDNASFFNLPDATGAIVSQVTPDSPAGHAGLKSGDVLREIDGQKIANGSALQVAVSEMAPGTTIDLGILRDGKPETIKITVGEFHKASSEEAENSGSGAEQGQARPGCRQSDAGRAPAIQRARPRSKARPLRAFARAARPTMRALRPAT